MYTPGGAVFGTLKSPVAGLKVEPAVGATVCVTVTLAGVAPVMPVAWSLVSTFKVAAVANGVVRLSVTASIRATVALVVLNLVVWLVVAMAGFAFPLRLDTSMAEFDFGKLFCTLFLARGVIQLILDAVLWLVMLSIAEP